MFTRRYGVLTAFAAAGLGFCLWHGRAQAPPPRNAAIQAAENARQLEMDRGSAALWQSLKKLQTRASVLLVTAHPDDEDGGMLTYESRGQGARAAVLTLNRGEGGANVMSGDFYDALGLVRTQELLAADRYFGVQQYFTRVVDFGFSKTEQETLDKWGHDRVLADVVRVVRETRPLVIASVFVGGPSDGHGNHAVAGEMAQEVFNAAGDPKMFPGQIAAGLRPWSPLKVYARVPVGAFTPKGIYDSASGVYTPGRVYDYVHKTWIEGQPSVTLEIPEGPYDPMLGASYIQIARQGLGEQRTQNGGIGIPASGPASTPYHLYAARGLTPGAAQATHENSYFDGIDTTVAGIADLAPAGDTSFLRAGLGRIQQLAAQALREYSAPAPEKVAPLLAQGLAQTNALLDQLKASGLSAEAKADVSYELEIKRAQFNDAIAEALGLSLSAEVAGGGGRGGSQPSFTIAIPGQRFSVQVHLDNPGNQPVTLDSVNLQGPADEGWTFSSPPLAAGPMVGNQPREARFEVEIPAGAKYTRPYYSRPNTEQPFYDIDDPRYVTLPQTPYPLAAWAHFTYQGVTVVLGQVVQTAEKVNGPGVVENPLVVAPAISVAISPHAGIVPLDAHGLDLTVLLHTNVKGPAQGSVHLQLPPGWSATPAAAAFSFAHDGEDQPIAFHIAAGPIAAKDYNVTAVADYGGRHYEEGYHVAGYAGIRPSYLYAPATYLARGVNVAIAPRLNVGYVTGTGDDVPQSLENLGVHVHFLSPQDLASAPLAGFDAIVLGIRAYAARPGLRTYNGRLLDYVQNGGSLIVQFNSSEFDHDFGPYPYTLGGNGERVVNEGSAVQILQPNNPVLRWPNRITADDFRGWVEERGHGFMASWDPRYQALVEMHDPDQKPQEGGMLYARYGKGVYIYAGLAFYRQLAEAVPGAYRIFANLLSVGHAPQ